MIVGLEEKLKLDKNTIDGGENNVIGEKKMEELNSGTKEPRSLPKIRMEKKYTGTEVGRGVEGEVGRWRKREMKGVSRASERGVGAERRGVESRRDGSGGKMKRERGKQCAQLQIIRLGGKCSGSGRGASADRLIIIIFPMLVVITIILNSINIPDSDIVHACG